METEEVSANKSESDKGAVGSEPELAEKNCGSKFQHCWKK